jgi:hypothetical protein
LLPWPPIFGRGKQSPDERGHARILLEVPADAAWHRVHEALDAAGDDWPEHLPLKTAARMASSAPGILAA